MYNHWAEHIEKNLPFLKNGKSLLAISGGVDSVVLAYLLKQFKVDFSLAHCNFNLRGKESDADEDFVLQLAETLDLEVFIQNFDTETYAERHKLSIQLAARELRYNWFNDLSTQLGFDYILTAHHADDVLETFLINLSRGTGLDGLTGIPEVNQNIVRPLLPFSREHIELYAKEHKLEWSEDSSNASTKYLRNKLRHDVIPVLKEITPNFLENFNVTLNNLKESNEIIEDRIEAVFDEVVDKITQDEIYFNISKIRSLSNPKAYLYQLLKEYGFNEWNDVEHLLTAQTGKKVLSKDFQLLKNREQLILSECMGNTTSEDIKIEENNINGNALNLPIGKLSLQDVDNITNTGSNVLYVDKDLLKFPLTVRHWQKGDYFYPFGMQGKKKISKFFKDEKVSLLAKEKIYLLCSNNNIVWVINHRADNRYKLTNKTKHILKICLD